MEPMSVSEGCLALHRRARAAGRCRLLRHQALLAGHQCPALAWHGRRRGKAFLALSMNVGLVVRSFARTGATGA